MELIDYERFADTDNLTKSKRCTYNKWTNVFISLSLHLSSLLPTTEQLSQLRDSNTAKKIIFAITMIDEMEGIANRLSTKTENKNENHDFDTNRLNVASVWDHCVIRCFKSIDHLIADFSMSVSMSMSYFAVSRGKTKSMLVKSYN